MEEIKAKKDGGSDSFFRELNAEEIAEVYTKYMEKDFPKSELKPLSAIMAMKRRGIYDCLGLFEEGKLRAYAFFAADQKREYMLLDYLAVCESYRGGGYGSRCLQKIREFYGGRKGVLLECESVDSTEDEKERQVRERRIHFYIKNGCVTTETRSLLFGVEFEILYLPLEDRKINGSKELKRLYQNMFSEEIYDRHVKIWRQAADFR